MMDVAACLLSLQGCGLDVVLIVTVNHRLIHLAATAMLQLSCHSKPNVPLCRLVYVTHGVDAQ